VESESGLLALVLHAHLPWVRHPEHATFLEESWLFEAITETYLPLVDALERLAAAGVPARITLSLSPTLLAMLVDPLLRARQLRYLESRIELAEREVARTRGDASFAALAARHLATFTAAYRRLADARGADLIGAFVRLADAGMLRLITTAATHGLLPLLAPTPQAVAAQLSVGIAEFRRLCGREPAGLWLPECGYYAGLDRVLADAHVRFICVESDALLCAAAPPVYGVYAPVYCPAGVAAFAREASASARVWSADVGYPGDPAYRDFYRDIGFDLPYEYVRPYLPPTGERVATGIKYHRVTHRGADKLPYDPDAARATAARHAAHYAEHCARELARAGADFDRLPLLTVPFDAELFGHWWHEGPLWLELLCHELAARRRVRMVTPDEYLDVYSTNQMAEPNPGTWGAGAHHEVWLCPANDWIYPHLHHAAARMVELARAHPAAEGAERRALDQAARELLLAQASDWPFMIARGTTVAYGTKRVTDHLGRFTRLADEIVRGAIDVDWLRAVELTDNLFPTLDYRVYA
jgi:1,4-alpha-glucan branching enzyme